MLNASMLSFGKSETYRNRPHESTTMPTDGFGPGWLVNDVGTPVALKLKLEMTFPPAALVA